MKIWILGAGGQLGRAVMEVCAKEHIPFIASTRAEIDITDLEKLKRAGEEVAPTHIINCAAYTDVDGAEKNHAGAFAVNALGAENVGIIGREQGIKVVHVSTDYVFGGDKETPYVETDRGSPLGIYGKSKWEGELRLLDQLGSACIVRTSWVFGSGGKNFISQVLGLLQTKEHIQAVDDQINRATYNRDLAKALIDLSCHSGVFHFANGEPLSRFQIVQDFYSLAQKRNLPVKCQKISPIAAVPSFRPKYSVLDTKKVELVLGRKPRVWETVLGEYFDAQL